VAGDMLGGMAPEGVTGLALWPEDLRHPFAFDKCAGPLLTPRDFQGRTIRSIPSALTWDLLQTLGSTPISVDDYGDMVDRCEIQGAESGLRQGASLPRATTATGDVVFYPKYQVLAANSAAFERLSEAQRHAIEAAAIATRDRALAEHPSEVDAAAKWCADGGSVVMAGANGIAAFEAASRPVFDRLEADRTAASSIQAIRALKLATAPALGASACAAAPEASTRESDTTGYTADLPPDGSYRLTMTTDDIIARGARTEYASINSGTWTWTFGGGEWVADHLGKNEHCEGTYASDGTRVMFVTTASRGCNMDYAIVWRGEPDGISMVLVGLPLASSAAGFRDEQVLIETTWIKVD
jgi:hypothetical protein